MSLWVVLLLFTLIALTNAENLSLTFTRDSQNLDIRCSLPDCHHGNITHVTSLVISRVKGQREEVIATTSSSDDDKDNLLGSTKTSAFSPDMTSESYVNLHWMTATKDLDAVYKCQVNGLDDQNLHVEDFVTKELVLSNTDPSLVLKPQSPKVGLTRQLDLNCSVANAADIGMSNITSIRIIAIRGNLSYALSSLDVFHGVKVWPGSEDANVTSHLGDNEHFLAMSWTHPLTTLTGRYSCEVIGLGQDNQPVHFVRYVEVQVQAPIVEELISTIHGFQKQNDDFEVKLENLENKNDKLIESNEKKINKMISTINGKNATISKLQEEVDFWKYPRPSCKDFNFPTGHHSAILSLNNFTKVPVICEVDDQGKVWTIFQRRFDGSVSFQRDFSDYEKGFGSTDGEFWLGLRNIKALMGDANHKLRLSLKASSISYEDNYPTFALSDGPTYRLTVQRPGDNSNSESMVYNNGQDFSTPDHGSQTRCAVIDKGGWWYKDCAWVNLNGLYEGDKNRAEAGMVWSQRRGFTHKLMTEVEMKFST